MPENKVDFYKGANWVHIEGNFTPDELREIADKIEAKTKEFKDGNKK